MRTNVRFRPTPTLSLSFLVPPWACATIQAIEEAAASVRSESAERIAALQAQVLELQAGG